MRNCDLHQRMDPYAYEVEEVLQARGPPEHRFYFLKYKGYGPEDNKWSPANWCTCTDKITDFCKAQGLAVEDTIPGGPNPQLGEKFGMEHRCIWCDKLYATNAALKRHHSLKKSNPGGCKSKLAIKQSRLTHRKSSD